MVRTVIGWFAAFGRWYVKHVRLCWGGTPSKFLQLWSFLLITLAHHAIGLVVLLLVLGFLLVFREFLQ